MSWSEAGDHGLIIAIDDFKNGNYSNIRLFYDWDKLKEYIKRTQGKDSEFYIVGREPYAGFFKEMDCLNAFELPQELRNISSLQKAVRERQSAGSHEAYTAKVKREIVQMKRGRDRTSGDDPSPDDFLGGDKRK